MALVKKDTGAALARAREALAALDARLEKLGRDREAALLGDDDGVVLKFDQQIEECERLIRTQRDRVRLLEAVVAKEEAERVAQRRAALITRIEKKLDERNVLVVEL
jgi:hypothetical protein